MTEFFIKSLISTLISFMSMTVKNPNSKRSRALRKRVKDLNEATEQFLEQVPAPEEE